MVEIVSLKQIASLFHVYVGGGVGNFLLVYRCVGV